MDRLTRDSVLMGMAELVAHRGTCSRLQVGVVLSRDGRVISTGYNGSPSGLSHCEHYEWDGLPDSIPSWVLQQLFKDNTAELEDQLRGNSFSSDGVTFHITTADQPKLSCPYSEHAERNAIAFAARHGVALEGSTMTVTHMPCAACAMSIINAGIKEVVYLRPYRITDGVALLERAGVTVIDASAPIA